jgi:hypothetical protein
MRCNRLITADPSAIGTFLSGRLETIRYMRAHKAETVNIERGITGFPPAVMAREYDPTIGMFKEDCRFDPQGNATLTRSFVDLNLVRAPPDMARLYTEALLPK